MTKKRKLTGSLFIKQVADTIKQYDMLRKGDKVLVGVSGGADSVCLLRALLGLRKKLCIELVVGNVDHGLRGKESEKDSAFVKSLSSAWGLECMHKRINVKSGGRKDTSIEERAREKRYAFFSEAALKKGCSVIATGHTMDDQAETVLMRIIYGSSLAGITGIPPVRYEKALRIVRPLIRTERSDILSFLERGRVEYVEDSTNRDMMFARNSTRSEVLPFLAEYNPKIKRSLVNLSDALREDFLFLQRQKKKAMRGHGRAEKGTVTVEIKDIILQPKALRKELFKELLRKAGGNIKKLTYRHWMDMDCLLRAGESNKALDLPGSIRVTKRGSELIFKRHRMTT